MKNLFVCLTFLFLHTANSQIRIQIHLPQTVFIYNSAFGQPLTSNNPAIAAVLSNYNLFYSETGAPGHVFSDESPYRVVNINPGILTPTQINNFIADLNVLPNVIYAAIENPYNSINRVLGVSLLVPNIGMYLNTVNNIVQTNNSQLNTIFQNFNVNKYENYYGSHYYLRCNCNTTNLKAALDNLTGVVNSTYFAGVYYLSTPTFENKKVLVFPNPFTNTIQIETNETILKYGVYDVIGKQFILTSSKITFDTEIVKLKQGVYFLNLTLDNSQTFTTKILKN